MKHIIKTHTVQGEAMFIEIITPQDGHDYFAITATIYRKGCLKYTDNNIERCGCCHQDILKKKRSLKQFVDLHLSENDGSPMYAVENGWYWVKQENVEYLASHLRITVEEAKRVMLITSKMSFTEYVVSQRPRWAKEAKDAEIALLAIIEAEKEKA